MTQNPEGRPKPSKRPRYRYVAFRVHAPTDAHPDRDEMIQAIQSTADRQDLRSIEPWLTRFNGEYGILRCLRGHEKPAARLLESVKEAGADGKRVRIEPLSTSGTIAGLQRKVLRDVRLDP